MRGPGTEEVKPTEADPARSDAKNGKKPTPFVLTVVATGANHSAFFSSKVRAQVAFNGIIAARKEYLEAVAANANHQADHVFDDDAGTRYIVALREFKSAQLADIWGEHWANGDRKLVEAYVAVEFQNFVQKHHAGLTLVRAQPAPGGGNLIRPGN